ncbi:MAG: hypothetical protein ACM3S4_04780 [Burkholderiales bacterium]
MTPKQEREWAQDIYKRVHDDIVEVGCLCIPEFIATIKGLAEGQKYIDKSFARKVTAIFETILWMRECQKGEITKEEFFERIEKRAKAQAEKQWNDRKKRIERQLHPRRKRKKATKRRV